MAATGLYSAGLWYHIGDDAILHAFFSTVCMNLEQGDWGTRFPNFMNNLYSEELAPDRLADGLKELDAIFVEFRNLPPGAIVWDIEDLSLPVPEDYPLPRDAQSLEACFITAAGENLFEMLRRALLQAKVEWQPVIITTLDQIPLASLNTKGPGL